MRIAEIAIASFRGIPGRLTIDFRSASDADPVSLILTGDNGTGKSSIVDAIELGLQGHYAQGKHVTSTRLPSLVSFAVDANPCIGISLSDGTFVERQLLEDEQGLLSTNTLPHPAFRVSPFVLRRADVLRFLDAPDAERTLVFWNYLRAPGATKWSPHPQEQLVALRDERLEAKVVRDKKAAELAALLGIALSEIPMGRRDFQLFVSEKLYGGFSKEEIEKRGYRLKVNRRAEELAETFLAAAERHTSLKARIKQFVVEADQGFPKHIIPEMNTFLGAVATRLTSAFKVVSPLPFLDRFDLEYGTIGDLALRIVVVLSNGRRATPRQLLSEANQDLLALLFFVALVQESASRGQAKVLILDDVLQSVDATIRVAFVDYLLTEQKDWQFLFTVHDRLWQSQLSQLLRRHSHAFRELDIQQWSFAGGPVVLESRSTLTASLIEALADTRPSRVCAEAGLLLERLCNELSVSLPISVIRRSGDRYTLGDLWPGTLKILRRTQASGIAEQVERWLHLRNLLGAHYNDWAIGVSLTEAQSFGQAVLAFTDSVFCKLCQRIVAMNAVRRDQWSCRCGAIALGRAED